MPSNTRSPPTHRSPSGRVEPRPCASMGRMKQVRASWLPAGLALLLAPASGAAEWISSDGSAVAERAESEEATRARAEADALARGLGMFLREWLSEAELQRRMPVLQPALFGRAGEYVEAVSDVARSKSGLRHFWSGRIEFDRAAIEQELRARGRNRVSQRAARGHGSRCSACARQRPRGPPTTRSSPC